jgi:hypothetical protein
VKPLTKKILESGLIPRTAAEMLEKWGQLEEGASNLVGKKVLTEESLSKFVDQIDALVDDHSVKETRLEIRVRAIHELWSGGPGYFSAAEDELGRLIINPRYLIKAGAYIYKWEDALSSDPKEATYRVMMVEDIYIKDTVCITQITVEKLGD